MDITGDESIIDAAINAFVRQHGWTDEVNGEPNPVTKTEAARTILLQFIMDTVTAYNTEQAAAAARIAAAEATETALYSTVMTLTVDQ